MVKKENKILEMQILKINKQLKINEVEFTLHSQRSYLKKLQKIYFDTNTSHHHHFYVPKEQLLIDVSNEIKIKGLPAPPKGKKIDKVEVVVHLKKNN